MAAELKDFRGKITHETWAVIEAEHRVTGRDHSEIVREVLQAWASKKLEVARITARLLESEGSEWNEREQVI